ncbi:MAG TPA: glycine zipper 2TM domain-containing protein, partial [Burkholderiaceae bacterium]
MKKPLLFALLAGSAALCAAQQEQGRVLSATPIVQQVGIPQQVCGSQTVVTQQPKTGAGAVMGAIAGGAVGNSIGGGGGRVASTALGVIGGALLGDSIEGGGQPQYQNVPTCTTQTRFENRTVGYTVVYEYAGRQYTTQTARDPGQYIPVQVSPSASNDGGYVNAPEPQAAYVQPQPGVVVPSYSTPAVVYAPAPYYSAP